MTLDQLRRFRMDQLDLVPIEFLEAVVEVLENGAVKYGRHSWEEGKHYDDKKNSDSCFHHLAEMKCGFTSDLESHLHPAQHLATRALMKYTLHKRGNE